MRKISEELKKDLASDPFYKKCCITGRSNGKIDWHHNLVWKGRQENEKFCILPLLKEIHDRVSDPEISDRLDWIMWSRATKEQIDYYSKVVDYHRRLKNLNDKFGIYNPSQTPVYQ
jgi:hypothetical protein